jgi:hypothetical protein
MTRGARSARVRATALEPCHGIVVEFRRPFDWAVALTAVGSELTGVLIVLFVTAVAGALAEFVLAIDVALGARNFLVAALERECRVWEVLAARRVEAKLGRMALFAIAPEFTLVLVDMTIVARQCLRSVEPPRMAELAIVLDLRRIVEAGQREATVHVMVERRRAGPAFDMAGCAGFVRELAIVCRPVLVTARAIVFAKVADFEFGGVARAARRALVFAE